MVGDYATRAGVGYVACGIIAFHLFLSISILVYNTLRKLRIKIVIYVARRSQLKQRERTKLFLSSIKEGRNERRRQALAAAQKSKESDFSILSSEESSSSGSCSQSDVSASGGGQLSPIEEEDDLEDEKSQKLQSELVKNSKKNHEGGLELSKIDSSIQA